MGKTLLFQAEYRPVTPGGVILFLEISFNSMDALARLLTADANSDSGKVKTNRNPVEKACFGACVWNDGF